MNIFLLFSLFQALFTRGAELASRSDTGLRKQTGEGEAFTGGGMFFPPKNGVPIFGDSEAISAFSIHSLKNQIVKSADYRYYID